MTSGAIVIMPSHKPPSVFEGQLGKLRGLDELEIDSICSVPQCENMETLPNLEMQLMFVGTQGNPWLSRNWDVL